MISDKNSVCKPKVMLIKPPQTSYEGSGNFHVHFPTGILYIAARARDKCDLKIFDCLVEKFQVVKKRKSVVYGASPKTIEKEIKSYHPDIVGISSLFSCHLDDAVRVADICKKVNPNILVVLGGPDASARGDYILSQNKSIDICVLKEGEDTFLEILEKFKNGHLVKPQSIKGIVYRKGKKVVSSPPRDFIKNLDKLPLPAYDLINFNKYLSHPYLFSSRSKIDVKSMSIITSRGCPYNCIFCANRLHMGRVFRAHSSEYVLKHLELLVKKYGIKNFRFEDDNISFDRKRFEEILDGIIKNKLNISWDTPNGVRADKLDFKLLKKVKKSGCVSLRIGVESGNQRVSNEIVKKGLDLKQVVKIAKWCQKLKIDLTAFYVIGFPGETVENMEETINFALSLYKKYSTHPFVMIATPLFGTELYKICRKKKFIKEPLTNKDLSRGTQLWGKHLIKTDDFSAKDIDNLVRYFLFEIAVISKEKGKKGFQEML